MKISVPEAVKAIEARGLLRRRRHDQSERVIPYVSSLIGQSLPKDLEDFYREHIELLGDFWAKMPIWNDWVGWTTPESATTELMHRQAVPLFGDGCGNLYGLDLSSGEATPAVYLFDHERDFEIESAAGSSLGAFLLLLADSDRAYDEKWPKKWELRIDPDLDKCPRAPPPWDG